MLNFSAGDLGAGDGEYGRADSSKCIAGDNNASLDGRSGHESEGGQEGGDGEEAGEEHRCE